MFRRAFFLLTLAACSSAPPASLPDAGTLADSGSGHDATSSADIGAAPDANDEMDASAAPDASVVDSGGMDAGTSTQAGDRRIDPIVLGRAWTYDVNVLGIYPACSAGVHTASTTDALVLDGKDALRVRSLCAGAGSFDYSVDGDRVYSHILGAWVISLDAPVAEGHSWTDGALQYHWSNTGTVTVPAGTFRDCWSVVTEAAYDSHTIFCRGVGPVHWHYEDGLGNGYDAVLTGKNF
ncbi:MAG: hypothetical protein U1E65_23060 [Myxococcota bacterium]